MMAGASGSLLSPGSTQGVRGDRDEGRKGIGYASTPQITAVIGSPVTHRGKRKERGKKYMDGRGRSVEGSMVGRRVKE